MSKLYVTEFSSTGRDAQGLEAQVAKQPALLDQTPVDFSGGVTQSAAFNAATTIVRLWSDVQCSVKFGSNPTATNQNLPLAAFSGEYFAVLPGQKVSVISNP
jgi:hypothetical protein